MVFNICEHASECTARPVLLARGQWVSAESVTKSSDFLNRLSLYLQACEASGYWSVIKSLHLLQGQFIRGVIMLQLCMAASVNHKWLISCLHTRDAKKKTNEGRVKNWEVSNRISRDYPGCKHLHGCNRIQRASPRLHCRPSTTQFTFFTVSWLWVLSQNWRVCRISFTFATQKGALGTSVPDPDPRWEPKWEHQRFISRGQPSWIPMLPVSAAHGAFVFVSASEYDSRIESHRAL